MNKNILLFLGFGFLVTVGWAEKWRPPMSDYSCETETISDGSTVQSKDYYSVFNGNSKQRHEMFGTIIIENPGKGTWVLFPSQKAFMNQTEPYDEVSPEGVAYKGFGRVTREKIIVKLDLKYVVDGESFHTVMQMRNLKIAKLDPALFEVPKGYKKSKRGSHLNTETLRFPSLAEMFSQLKNSG
ncbi:MAG: hypothetical protein IPN90_12020 [Elusimicrobia bacterium]|nr:hypothetical protein [Elusimicrobiota bacterium]